jgi:tungstate transport system substrate-binding protein
MEWILSDEIQKVIGEFGVEEFGQPLFTPNAK